MHIKTMINLKASLMRVGFKNICGYDLALPFNSAADGFCK